ncbi:MAG: hypothetical protein AAFU58_07525, partial [Pseudomonadota bacterium]
AVGTGKRTEANPRAFLKGRCLRRRFFRKEIYVSSALLGSSLYTFLPDAMGFSGRALFGMIGAFSLRLAAMHWQWAIPFPRYRASDER